jgi:hypothetical protein
MAYAGNNVLLRVKNVKTFTDAPVMITGIVSVRFPLYLSIDTSDVSNICVQQPEWDQVRISFTPGYFHIWIDQVASEIVHTYSMETLKEQCNRPPSPHFFVQHPDLTRTIPLPWPRGKTLEEVDWATFDLGDWTRSFVRVSSLYMPANPTPQHSAIPVAHAEDITVGRRPQCSNCD